VRSTRHGQDFETWLSAVEASPLPELHRFAHSLLKDRDAVVAGLTLSYSNGPVEAQVHKLNLVKRSMYGRAKLPLLQQRLLHAACWCVIMETRTNRSSPQPGIARVLPHHARGEEAGRDAAGDRAGSKCMMLLSCCRKLA